MASIQFLARLTRVKIVLAFCLLMVPCQTLMGQAFVMDTSAVPAEYRRYFEEVEADLNTRIQAYSEELPKSMLYQLDRLFIVALVAPAPNGVLGFAGPRAIITHVSVDNQLRTRRKAVPVTGTITINANMIAEMEVDGTLLPTIAHEILHVFGFGSLWTQNRLIGPLNEFGAQPIVGLPQGIGLIQYLRGRYALEQYRIETKNRFAAFVPIEQFGGSGTSLAHWSDEPPFFNQTFTPAFTKELMTGFACDTEDQGITFVCPPTFFSMTTEGALADLGFAMYKINPNKTKPPTGLAGRDWPKIVGSGRNPFADRNDPFNGGGNLSFRAVNIVNVYRSNSTITAGLDDDDRKVKGDDPFNLRNHKWAPPTGK